MYYIAFLGTGLDPSQADAYGRLSVDVIVPERSPAMVGPTGPPPSSPAGIAIEVDNEARCCKVRPSPDFANGLSDRRPPVPPADRAAGL